MQAEKANKPHESIHKTSLIAFSLIATLIVACSTLIKYGLDAQSNMLDILGISYEQRILLERTNKQIRFLVENGQQDTLTDRIIENVRQDIVTNFTQISDNQKKMTIALTGSVHTQEAINSWLLPRHTVSHVKKINFFLERFEQRVREIRTASVPALKTGYNFWKPVDTLIAHNSPLLKDMAELNSSVNRTAVTLNQWLYILYAAMLLLLLLGLWLIWFFTLRPMAHQIKKNYEKIAFQNSVLTHNNDHDSLTGLKNRMSFNQHINQLAAEDRLYNQAGLVLIDVDHFKNINDGFGHQMGDEALLRIAGILEKYTAANEYAYRLSGDEFALVLENISTKQQLLSRMQQLSADLAPLAEFSEQISVTCSMGVAWGKECGSTLQEIFNAADTALYHVKENGKNHFKFHDEISQMDAPLMLKLEGELHQALQNKQFIVHYQPIIQLDNNQIIGFEALVRWQHPIRKVLLPADWMKVAERLSLMSAITDQVIDIVISDCSRWSTTHLPPCQININITEAMLINGLAFERLNPALSSNSELHLAVEVTESIFFHRSLDTAARQLDLMHKSGIRIALDDFGAGFANLSHLRHIACDTLKIDHSFTSSILEDNVVRVIIKSIIDMAASLNKKVVCEGVDNIEVHKLLLEMGCNYAQGFLYSEALPFEQLASLAKRLSAFKDTNTPDRTATHRTQRSRTTPAYS